MNNNLKMFAIKDESAKLYYQPKGFNTTEEAQRWLSDVVNFQDKTNNMIAKYPEQFDLYEIGLYDQNSGKFLPLKSPKHCSKAIDLVQKNQ